MLLSVFKQFKKMFHIVLNSIKFNLANNKCFFNWFVHALFGNSDEPQILSVVS